jgi:hypothetical protein
VNLDQERKDVLRVKMKKSKAIIRFLGNFFLGALGVVGVGWFLIVAYPKTTKTVYIVGSLCILMCLWSAFDDMRKRLKPNITKDQSEKQASDH